jgi:hypothetical protein
LTVNQGSRIRQVNRVEISTAGKGGEVSWHSTDTVDLLEMPVKGRGGLMIFIIGVCDRYESDRIDEHLHSCFP